MSTKTTEFDLIETALMRYSDESGIIFDDYFKIDEEIKRLSFGVDNRNVLRATDNNELFNFKVISEAIKYFQMGAHPGQGTEEDINLTRVSENIDEIYILRNSLKHDGYSASDQKSKGIAYSAYDVPLIAMESIELKLTVNDILNVFADNVTGIVGGDDDRTELTGSLPITMEAKVQTVNISKVLAAKNAVEIAKENPDLWSISVQANTAMVESICSSAEHKNSDSDSFLQKARSMVDDEIKSMSAKLNRVTVNTGYNSITSLFLPMQTKFTEVIKKVDNPESELKEELKLLLGVEKVSSKKKHQTKSTPGKR